MWLGRASEAEIISEDSEEISSESKGEGASSEQHAHDQTRVCVVTAGESAEQRRRKLAEIVRDEGANLPWQERSRLHSLLLERHQDFSLEDGEWGETSLVEMHIDTGFFPRKQPVHRIPFAVRQEVATQLCKMQDSGVI